MISSIAGAAIGDDETAFSKPLDCGRMARNSVNSVNAGDKIIARISPNAQGGEAHCVHGVFLRRRCPAGNKRKRKTYQCEWRDADE